jgi:plastocyanin
MRRYVWFVVLALGFVACTRNSPEIQPTSASPGVDPTLSPTVESISPTSAASAYPSGSPAASGTGTLSCTQPKGGEVQITARNVQFDTACILVPAGPVKVELRNKDSRAHTFAIYRGDTEVYNGATVQPGEDHTFKIPALGSGTYEFQCDIHPEMNGTFVVGTPGA